MDNSCARFAIRRCGGRRRIFLLLLSGLSFSAAAAPHALAQNARPVRAASINVHAAHLSEAAQRFGIPVRWIVAVMRGESAGDVRAVSSAGAVGLMQIMPDTWAELRTRYGLGRDPYTPRDNILAGAAYLREMWDRYGDIGAMLAAYNAGPARYDEHRATGRPLPAETRAYVDFLAPALRGERPSKGASTAARPFDWREATLFVVSVFSDSAANAAPREGSPDKARPPVPATSDALAALQSRGLFGAPSTDGGRP